MTTSHPTSIAGARQRGSIADRRSLLNAALGFVRVEPRAPELRPLHRLLDAGRLLTGALRARRTSRQQRDGPRISPVHPSRRPRAGMAAYGVQQSEVAGAAGISRAAVCYALADQGRASASIQRRVELVARRLIRRAKAEKRRQLGGLGK